MPSPELYKAPFHCDQHYHLIFKSHDGLFLFKNNGNKIFFLKKFSIFASPVMTCLAYCLLENHAHFITTVKGKKMLQQSVLQIPDQNKTVSMKKFLSYTENNPLVDELIERQVNSLMVSYTNSFNKVYQRKGGLFQSPFTRALITGDAHLQQAIIYVHANAQKHGLVKDFRLYSSSSYNEIVAGKSNLINVNEVLNFFGGEKKYIEQHKQQTNYYYTE